MNNILESVRIHLIETLGTMNSFRPSIFLPHVWVWGFFLLIRIIIEDYKESDGENQSEKEIVYG